MERTKFKSIEGIRMIVRIATADDAARHDINVNEGDVLIIRADGKKKLLAFVSADDIFDHYGNRFEF